MYKEGKVVPSQVNKGKKGGDNAMAGMKISDLPTGVCFVTLLLQGGEKRRVRGKVVEKESGKYLVARQSPKRSYGPGTQVLRAKEVK